MKLDIFKGQWIDIVFENKNKTTELINFARTILRLQ
jgi:hypothetical protein